jgi:hypothetical protein
MRSPTGRLRPSTWRQKKIARKRITLIVPCGWAIQPYLVAHILAEVNSMRLLASILLTTAFASCVLAQQEEELASGDAFFGFSLLHANSSQPILAYTSYGGVGSLGWNINEHIGIEAEFGGYHNGTVNAYHNDTNSVTYLFGPRWSYGRLKRYDPYFHVLLGGVHTATSVLNPPMVNPLIVQRTPARHTVSQDGFTMAIGGGVDIRINKYVSFRPVQVDYMPTMLSNLGPNGLTNNSFRSNFQYAVGFMFQDYEHW